MIFDIDAETIIGAIVEALESVGADTSEQQFFKIVEAVNNGVPGIIEVLTVGATEFWKQEARENSPWGNKYARIIKNKISETEGEIFLDEESIDKESKKPNFMFAKMVEEGVKSWSIKDSLLASERAKTGKDGVKYITVPFPVATPRRAGQGTMKNKFGKREMTAAMHEIVKAGGKLSSGTLNLPNGTEVDVSGLVKYNTRQRHSQYGIFRRVSSNSSGWIFPGVPATPVYPNVLNEINEQIHNVVSEFCKDIVLEYSGK